MNSVRTKQGTELPLLNLKGKAYLQVAYRLVWFREDHPDWSIETSFELMGDKFAMGKAVIKDASGRIIATGHKYEDMAGFGDFREKAETGSIGRALALCGYGTQFTDDTDEGGRIVDSPVPAKHGPRPIVPDQPSAADGSLEPAEYRVPFGKFINRGFDELFRDPAIGPDGVKAYIRYLETTAYKKGVAIEGPVAEFIERAEKAIAQLERQWADQTRTD